MNRLVGIVEGHGEVEAIPSLCHLVMRHLGVTGWFVDKEPILKETRGVDVAFLRSRSRSFDKFVRSIAMLCGTPADHG